MAISGRLIVRGAWWAAAAGAVLALAGCPVSPPKGQGPSGAQPKASPGRAAATKAEALATVPDTGPGLTPGEYDLKAVATVVPLWRDAGPALVGDGKGHWSGALYDQPAQLALVMSRDGAGGYTLSVRQTAAERAEGSSAAIKGEPAGQGPGGARVVFAGLKAAKATLSLGVEIPKDASARTARSYYVQSGYTTALVKMGEGQVPVHLLADFSRRPLGQQRVAWVDLDKNGQAEEWEVAELGAPVGVAGRICTLRAGTGPRAKLAVAGYDQPTGVVAFDATDGNGQPGGVYAPAFMGKTLVRYLGVVQAVQAPAGGFTLQYAIPGGSGGGMGSATVPGSLSVEAGKAIRVKAGGPVQVKVEARSQSGNVMATVNLQTATGHGISGGSGEGASGKVEILGAEGKILQTGSAEFG
jgi:hypothetical protein